MPRSPWGATPEDWRLFSDTLGLTADLLPVVSKPGAAISPRSNLKALGKVPSIYNAHGEVMGILGWTSKQSNAAQVQSWSTQPDYGICLQTRHVRALDIDVEDQEKADKIAARIHALFGVALGERSRPNSGKLLLAFVLRGEFPKRILKVDGGMIEFLGNGQHFVATGTHTSGVRYEWNWNGVLHEVTADVFEALWKALEEEFGQEPAQNASMPRKNEAHTGVYDRVAGKLDVLGTGHDSQLYITCPFEAEHTSPSNIPDTCYFPAGTGGYENGHFKCLHAHCHGRNDGDFLDALGLRDTMFGDVLISSTEANVPEPFPILKRKPRTGEVLATVDNVMRVLPRVDLVGLEIGQDDFKGCLMKRVQGLRSWVPFEDNDYTALRQTLEGLKFVGVGRELIRDCVDLHAQRGRFDSGKEWLADVPAWDGVERVERFVADYFGGEPSPYNRAVSRYLWTALAGRLMQPGVKADMVTIFCGPQGTGKTGMSKLLAPFDDTFVEISFAENEDTLARKLRGKVAVEIGELKGLASRDLEHIKSFVTQTHEEWVPKYREHTKSYPRRCVFIGTTNHEEFLSDPTGNRRWLPVMVTPTAPKATADERARGVHAFEAFKHDRLQFWAEARLLFTAHGVMALEAERLARDVHLKHTVHDSWQDMVTSWLEREEIDGKKPAERDALRVVDVLREAVSIAGERITRAHEMRIAAILKGLGYEKKLKSVEGKVSKVWVKDVVH